MRLDPSPIPKGKHTANSNRAYLSPDTTVSISGHILFIRSEAEGSAFFSDASAAYVCNSLSSLSGSTIGGRHDVPLHTTAKL